MTPHATIHQLNNYQSSSLAAVHSYPTAIAVSFYITVKKKLNLYSAMRDYAAQRGVLKSGTVQSNGLQGEWLLPAKER